MQNRMNTGRNGSTTREMTYIHPDNNTFYTDGSGDGSRAAAAIVHKEEDIFIRLNDSASLMDAEMTAIQIILEESVK